MVKNFRTFLNEDILNEKLITFGGRAYPQYGQVVIMAGGAGCYPKGTEFFSHNGWKNIEDFEPGDKVLQYNSDTTEASFTDQAEFVDLPTDQFYTIKNNRVEFTTSENHKHLLISEKTGRPFISKTSDMFINHNKLIRGNKAKLITSFSYDGPGLDLTDDEIRLKIAIIADGHVLPQRKTIPEPKIRVKFKKTRKIDRFVSILDSVGIQYSSYKEGNGFTTFEFYYESDEKEFRDYWYNASNRQLRLIAEEVLEWDGCIHERVNKLPIKTFSSCSKKSADFIQFAFSAIGFDASVDKDIREGKNTGYVVRRNNSRYVGISKDNRHENTTSFEKVDAGDRMYCFQVPSGFFIVRQNDKIFVSGNSGKGFTQSYLIGVEGVTLDPDKMKILAIKSKDLSKKIKDETEYDLKTFDLRIPENVSKIHEILSDHYKIVSAKERAVLVSALTADPRRKPNLIFDTTLANMSKLLNISSRVQEMGYDKKNIHLVWVVNEFQIAMKQNRERGRVVPDEILLSTHEGASLTIKKLLSDSNVISKYLDGDIWLSFNKKGLDSTLIKGPNTLDKNPYSGKELSGGFLEDSNYIKVKSQGKKSMTVNDMDKYILAKIRSYVPNVDTW